MSLTKLAMQLPFCTSDTTISVNFSVNKCSGTRLAFHCAFKWGYEPINLVLQTNSFLLLELCLSCHSTAPKLLYLLNPIELKQLVI